VYVGVCAVRVTESRKPGTVLVHSISQYDVVFDLGLGICHLGRVRQGARVTTNDICQKLLEALMRGEGQRLSMRPTIAAGGTVE
jgi:hypothetical protein